MNGFIHPLARYIPLIKNSKKPAISRWSNPNAATVQFDSTWSNYGLRLDNLLVIDIDCDVDEDGNKNPLSAYAKLKQLKDAGIPKTMVVRTGSGGYHLYYIAHELFKTKQINALKGIINGIDILTGRGSFVVGPNLDKLEWEPGHYTLEHNEPISTNTELVIEAINGIKKQNNHISLTQQMFEGVTIADSRNADYYMSLDVIPIGERDNACFQLADLAFQRGLYKDPEALQRFFDKIPLEIDKHGGKGVSFEQFQDKVLRLSEKNKLDIQPALDECILIKSSAKVFFKSMAHSMSVADARIILPTKIQRGKRQIPIIDLWIESPLRNEVWDTTFTPGQPLIYQDPLTNKSYVNTYTDESIKPSREVPGPEHQHIRPLLNIWNNLIPDDESLHWFIAYLAHKLKNHDWQPTYGPYLISTHFGVGKGLTFQLFALLLGTKYSAQINTSNLYDDKDGFLENKLAVNLNEIHSRKGLIDRVKLFMSERRKSYRHMGVVLSEEKPNYICPFIETNNINAFKLDRNERRFLVLYCQNTPAKVQDELYWLASIVNNPNRHQEELSNIAAWLMSHEYDETLINKAYKTPWFHEVATASMDDAALDVKELMEEAGILMQTKFVDNATIEYMLMDAGHKATRGLVRRVMSQLIHERLIIPVNDGKRINRVPYLRRTDFGYEKEDTANKRPFYSLDGNKYDNISAKDVGDNFHPHIK